MKQTGSIGKVERLHENVKLHKRIKNSTKDGHCTTGNSFFKDSTRNVLLQESRLEFQIRSQAIRRSSVLVVISFLLFFTGSIVVFVNVGKMTVQTALLYGLYSMTSCGFGSVQVPETTAFLLFAVFYMFAAIAFLLVVVAQVYLLISSEIKRSKLSVSRDMTRNPTSRTRISSSVLKFFDYVSKLVSTSERGRLVVIGGYLAFQLLFASFIMMPLEDWSFAESLYFVTYVLTTVGYGDVAPATSAGIWFTIFLLPFSIIFIPLYTGNVARYYAKLNLLLARRFFRNGLTEAKIITDEMHNLVEVITTIGKKSDNAATESTITTMGDIVKIVVSGFATNDISMKLTPETELDRFLRLNTYARQSKSRGQPSFAVQVLVQERLARIIVECFAGLSSAIVLDGTTCFIPIELFDVVVEQYHIPYGSREAFVIAAIDVMMYLGDKDFVLKGIEGLLDLPPLEFHSLFVPVLAAFEDADTMERWLAAVEKYPIADVSFEELELISLKSQQDESRQSTRITLSQSDISCLSSLSDEFDRCLKMKQIKYHSVYLANRQLLTSLCVGFLTYQTIVTIIVSITANVSARQAITFTLYTITSAGFGSVMIPKSTGFLLFAVMNVYVSISGLSMLIAQCISYFLAHDKRSNHQYSKRMLAKAGMATIDTILNSSNNPNTLKGKMLHELRQCLVVNAIVPEPNPEVIPKSVPSVHRNHVGEGYLLGGTLLILLFVGTFCTMAIEQWSFVYGLYFSTFALLTVGHGDIVPTSSAGEWFVNFLLPFNFIFVMFYFWMIARIYVRFHGANLTRIEKKLRENLRTNDGTTSSKPSEAKTSNDQLVGSSVHSSESKKPRNRTKQRSNLSKVSDFDKSAGSQKNSGSDIVDSSAPSNLLKQLSDFSKLSECDSSAGPMVNAIRSEMSRRYVRIKQTSDISRMLECDFNDEEYTLATTIAGNKPVLARYLLEQINLAEHSIEGNSAGKVVEESDSVEKNLREAIAGNADNTIVESHGMAISRKVATLIRVARIVIENTRIFKGVIEFDEGYLKLRIGSLNECLDLWKIPQQGRSVFRQVFVDAVLYVGEKQIFEKGIAAFFDLTIVEFVELFSPFVFALGDDDAINHWLVDTEDLSQEIFSTTMERPGDLRNTKLSERRFLDNSLEKFFPVNASNSVLVELNRTLRTRSGMRS